MVISQNVICAICASEYFVRIGVGYDSYQKHSFDCLECLQPIGVAVRAKAPNAHIEVVENCTFVDIDDSKTVINLHPNCCFPVDKYHERMSFPSLKAVNLIARHVRAVPGKFQDIATQFDIPNAANLWNKVKAIVNLSESEGKEKHIDKLIVGYNKERKKHKFGGCECKSANDVLNEFCDSLFYPRVNDISKPVLGIIDSLFEQGKLDDFYKYYSDNLKKENQNRYISTLTSFFRYRDILGQLVDRARIWNEDVDDMMVGSKNFDEIKLYYGEVYEALTSNFTVLACLNNLHADRQFDEFKQMTLAKYIKDVEKAKRDNPFKGTAEFAAFSEQLDSSLRNGSHHASIWRDGEVVMFKSGGTGAERNISYSRYLHMCNVVTISLVALYMIELHMVEKYS